MGEVVGFQSARPDGWAYWEPLFASLLNDAGLHEEDARKILEELSVTWPVLSEFRFTEKLVLEDIEGLTRGQIDEIRRRIIALAEALSAQVRAAFERLLVEYFSALVRATWAECRLMENDSSS